MKALRWVLIILLTIIVVGGIIGFVVLRNNSAKNEATDFAKAALTSDDRVSVTSGDQFVFTPVGTTPDTGLVIYPGGLVDPVAYAPLARDIAAQGYLVVLDQAPLDLAVIDAGAAAEIIAAYPQISAWAIGGHSLGGAMAADYAFKNPAEVAGLALWAAYPADNRDLSGLDLEVVSVWGSNDGLTTAADIEDSKSRLPADAVYVEIVGGNHTQFGYYGTGLQSGDNPAGVSADEQQRQIAEATVNMLKAIDPTP